MCTCKRIKIRRLVDRIHAVSVYRIPRCICNSNDMFNSFTDVNARTLKEAAEAALQLGDSDSAGTLLDRALNLYEIEPKGCSYAQIAIARGDLYWSAQQLQAARELYTQALTSLTAEFGEQSEVVGICLRNLSEICREQGDSLLAKQYKKRWQEIMCRHS
jgi:tetratricopeptide (TPR) repeat protein